jgi:hypothetical protein
MKNYADWIEDNNAWFSRADRFDGFDRGDRANADDEMRQAMNEAFLAEMLVTNGEAA